MKYLLALLLLSSCSMEFETKATKCPENKSKELPPGPPKWKVGDCITAADAEFIIADHRILKILSVGQKFYLFKHISRYDNKIATDEEKIIYFDDPENEYRLVKCIKRLD